jgi:predicted small lipoprotein YifL
MHKLGLLLVLLICLSGCGQKGPLYLPDADTIQEPR